jgi:hypothetical protein
VDVVKSKSMAEFPLSYIIRFPNNLADAFCGKCKTEQTLDNFYIHSKRSDGAIRYRPVCKKCRSKGKRDYWKKGKYETRHILGEQICLNCKITKPLKDFYKNGVYSDGITNYRALCKVCCLSKIAKISKKNYQSKAQKRSASAKNFIAGIYNHCSKRKLNLGFDLDCEYLNNIYEKQKGLCALTGVEMTYKAGNGRVYTNISIDRIDSNKGYIKNNVQFVCDIVNVMKSNLTLDEFYFWCKKVLEIKSASCSFKPLC